MTAGFVKNEQGVITPDPSVSRGTDLTLGGIGTASESNHAVPMGQGDLRYLKREASGARTFVVNEEVDGISAVTYGDAGRYRTVITISDTPFGDLSATPQDLVVPLMLGQFNSEGAVITGVSSGISIQGTGTEHDVEYAFGSASNEEAEATIAAITDPTASDVSNGLMSTSDMTSSLYGGYKSAGAVCTSLYVNCAAAWLADNEGILTMNGTVVVVWDDLTLA